MRSIQKIHRFHATAWLCAGMAAAILVLGAFDSSAGRGVTPRVLRWTKVGIYNMLLREGALSRYGSYSPDRQFVDFRRSSQYSEAIHQEVYLTTEEIAVMVLLANLKTSMAPRGAFKQDLLGRQIVVHMNREELYGPCGSERAEGCRASDSVIHLYGYPEKFTCADRGCSFFDAQVREARELLRGKLIHELMHGHQPPHDPSCPADPVYPSYDPATDPTHPCLTSQWGQRASWPRVEDENKACFDGFTRKIYGFLPYAGFSEQQVLQLCRSPYPG